MTYEACDLCPRACGVDRTRGERGACRMTSRLVLARAALHHWEEPCISGTAGSGTVFFSGCPLGCVYCQNHEIADGSHGLAVDDGRLEEIFFELRDAGAHNLNLVTPTHFAPTVAKAIRRARERADRLRVVRKRHRLHRHFARCEGLRQQRRDRLAAKGQNVFLHRIHSLWHEYSTPRAG